MVAGRIICKAIDVYLKKYPIVALTGPRQSGKTTVLRHLLPDYRYVSLENPDVRQFAETDPNAFLQLYDRKVILDEVQRVPKLFSYLQTIVDTTGEMGQFVLSGSQNFHLMQSITQSLAGRVALFKLLPFDFSEMRTAGFPLNDFAASMIRGFYPALFDRDIPSKVFYANYISTYVERDVSELLSVRDARQFRKFLGLCASRAGQLLNLNTMAQDCGITQPTAKAWLSVLESSYIVFLLQPYSDNFSKRVIKTPKLYFYDTGLLAHLLKISDAQKIKTLTQKETLFENMIVSEKLKQNYHNYLQQELYFWRDSNQNEVDLLVLEDDRMDVYEIKSTETISSKLFESLHKFTALAGDQVSKEVLVYAGKQSQKRSYAEVRAWIDC